MLAAVSNPKRRTLALGAVAVVVLIVYLVAWLQLDWQQQGRADFGNAYVGGEILRSGQGAHLYDTALNYRMHEAAIAPDSEGSLPFLDAPPAAALALPFTFLDLRTAWRLWSLLQLAMLAAAVGIAAACAPWPARDGRLRTAAALLGAAGIGTLLLAIQGQWTGLFALGVAGGYSLWRRGNLSLGSGVALGPILAVKPNLALGLIVFMLGWGNRRVLIGALGCAAAVALASLAMAGVSGTAGFFQAAAASTQQWPSSSMNGINGIVGSLFGSAPLVTTIGLVGSAAAAAFAFPLGRKVRRTPELLEPALAGAVTLSLLASPHLYHHDLTLLAPGFVLGFATAVRIDAVRGTAVPGRVSLLLAGCWVAFIAVGYQQITAPLTGFPGRLVPWFLIAFAAMAFGACRGLRLRAVDDKRRTALGFGASELAPS